MNIDTFKSNLIRRGISRPNLFSVYIQTPYALGYNLNATKSLLFKAYSLNIPDKTVSTSSRRTYGPIQKVSYCDPIYSDIVISIICSEDLYERNIFEKWLDFIIKPDSYLVEYYDRYITKTVINKLDSEGKDTIRYELHDSYPVNLGAQKLDWSETDSYLTFDVTFTYRYYTVQTF